MSVTTTSSTWRGLPPLLRWLNFRQRNFDPSPRPAVLSDKFPIANLPNDAKKGLRQLVEQ